MRKILLTLSFFIAFQAGAFCQSRVGALDHVILKLKSAITDYKVEKAYLHFDRPYLYYVAGETVFFKAYVTMGELHEPSTISGILHVELIGKRNELLQSENIQLTNGTGWGDFALPDTMSKGSYHIRAYTQWMRNDPDGFFNQYISVSSMNSADRVAEAVKQTAQPTIEFSPEGGNLVTGIRSKIAFKAIGTNGLGINVKAIILDNENNEISSIASTRLGMGIFHLIPQEGKSYHAKISFSNGTQTIVNLPQVESKGITLAVNTDDPSRIAVEIKANADYFRENLNKELNLLLYGGGAVRSVTTTLDKPVLSLILPATNVKTGILQVTLFSQTGEPLNERIAFIKNNDLLNLSLITDKQVYAKRERVDMQVNAKNPEGVPAQGSFSVSVIDESKILVDENTESTLLSNLLLTSDLKGCVEKPGYYFANSSQETRADLDVLMLTQGYRRFVWKRLLNNDAATVLAYKPEQSMAITGKVKTKNGTPIPGMQVSLLPVEGVPVVETTDAAGNFRFENMSFIAGDQVLLKTHSSRKNPAIITLEPPADSAPVLPGNPTEAKYNYSADILGSFQSSQHPGVMTASNDSKMFLKNDETMRAKRSDNYKSSNIGGPGHADQVINGDDFRNASTLTTALNGVARNVSFVRGVAYLTTVSMVLNNQTNFVEPMLIVVDGAIVPGGNVDNYTPSNVQTVEIVSGSNAAIYGMSAGVGGALVITTRQGEANQAKVSTEMSPGIYAFTPGGFYKAKEFYSPRYDAAPIADKSPDMRTTIFWKPDVITDMNGNASFNFFNADGSGTYRVVIEGIDSKGNLGRQVYKYKVE